VAKKKKKVRQEKENGEKSVDKGGDDDDDDDDGENLITAAEKRLTAGIVKFESLSADEKRGYESECIYIPLVDILGMMMMQLGGSAQSRISKETHRNSRWSINYVAWSVTTNSFSLKRPQRLVNWLLKSWRRTAATWFAATTRGRKEA